MIAVKGENFQSGQKSKYQITVYFQETHFKYKDTDIKAKGWRKIYHANTTLKKKSKQAGVTILISDKVDFHTENYQG